jgi:hypothetical protein
MGFVIKRQLSSSLFGKAIDGSYYSYGLTGQRV